MVDRKIYCKEEIGRKPGFYYQVDSDEEGQLIQDYIEFRKNNQLTDDIVEEWAKKYSFTSQEVVKMLLKFNIELNKRKAS